MQVIVNHSLTKEEAKKRILKLSEELKKEYDEIIKNYSEKWKNSSAQISFRAMGLNINGKLDIFDDKITMKSKLPLVAQTYKSQIKSIIKTKLTELLD